MLSGRARVGRVWDLEIAHGAWEERARQGDRVYGCPTNGERTLIDRKRTRTREIRSAGWQTRTKRELVQDRHSRISIDRESTTDGCWEEKTSSGMANSNLTKEQTCELIRRSLFPVSGPPQRSAPRLTFFSAPRRRLQRPVQSNKRTSPSDIKCRVASARCLGAVSKFGLRRNRRKRCSGRATNDMQAIH